MIRGVQHLVDKIRDLIYPVNSLYISTSATSPASYFGGTWERYGTGRALISASDTDTDFKAGTTGGSKTHNHKHYQTIGGGTNADPTVYFAGDLAVNVDSPNPPDGDTGDAGAPPARRNWQANRVTRLSRQSEYGNGTFVETQTHGAWVNVLEPYVAVYVWRRTA